MAGERKPTKTPGKHKLLGARVRAARLAMRPEMTQGDLATALGVDSNHVSRIERGLVKPPSKGLAVLERVLGKPRSYFVNEPLEESPTATPSLRAEHVVDLDARFVGYPNLRALTMSTAWTRASEGARRLVLDEAARSGGDLELDDWLAELKSAERRATRGTAGSATTDAFGREVGEVDEVDDPDAE